MHRDIVIAGHDNLRFGQLVKKDTRFDKLAGAGTLRQISGDGYEIGMDTVDRRNQRRDDFGVDATKMYIGEMYY